MYCLQQLVSKPKRLQNILDLFLTNNTELIIEIKIKQVTTILILVATFIDLKKPNKSYALQEGFTTKTKQKV